MANPTAETEATLPRMGAWGTGLFDDDLANDMRDLRDDTIAQGSSATEASAAIRDNFEQDCAEDYDDAPVFWLVLASLQQDAETLQPTSAIAPSRRSSRTPISGTARRTPARPPSATTS